MLHISDYGMKVIFSNIHYMSTKISIAQHSDSPNGSLTEEKLIEERMSTVVFAVSFNLKGYSSGEHYVAHSTLNLKCYAGL